MVKPIAFGSGSQSPEGGASGQPGETVSQAAESQLPSGGTSSDVEAGTALAQYLETLPPEAKSKADGMLGPLKRSFMREADYRQKTADLARERRDNQSKLDMLEDYQTFIKHPLVMSAIGIAHNKPNLVHDGYRWMENGQRGNPAGPNNGGGAGEEAVPETVGELMEFFRKDRQQMREELRTEMTHLMRDTVGKKIGSMEDRTMEGEFNTLLQTYPQGETQRVEIMDLARRGLSMKEAFFAKIGGSLGEDLTRTRSDLDDSRIRHQEEVSGEGSSAAPMVTLSGDALKGAKGKGLGAYQDALRAEKLLPSQTRSPAQAPA